MSHDTSGATAQGSRRWDGLFSAQAKMREAALEIDAAGRGVPELEKLAAEVMRMASVTEIVAYAMRAEMNETVSIPT